MELVCVSKASHEGGNSELGAPMTLQQQAGNVFDSA